MSASISDADLAIFRRYAGLSLPRHVSYPMPTWWQDVDETEAAALYEVSRGEPANDLSLYVHVPFCEKLCKFCACTRVVLPKDKSGATERVEAYLAAMEREIACRADLAGDGRALRQVHWGGGSPLYLTSEQMSRIQNAISKAFSLAPDAEIAVEIDPRQATRERIEGLRRLGFNRISLGVQDFNEQVQEHVHRVQPFELVRDTVEACRAAGFASVNFDLIYGLPYQTVETVRDTVERSIGLSPDRVAYYHYAQIPEKIATQRGMDYTKLPDSDTKLEMFLSGVSQFEEAGYEFVGLDHLAKPDESLARARAEGTLQRNFQGMTTGGGLDLIAVGASSISHLAGVGFLQNTRDIAAYVESLENGKGPIHRGKRFTRDDLIRQAVLADLYCLTEVRADRIERQFGIVFGEYFARELKILEELEKDGLIVRGADETIRVTYPLGRVLLRNIAAVFDAYLAPDAYRAGERECFSANA